MQFRCRAFYLINALNAYHAFQVSRPKLDHFAFLLHVAGVVVMLAGDGAALRRQMVKEQPDKLIGKARISKKRRDGFLAVVQLHVGNAKKRSVLGASPFNDFRKAIGIKRAVYFRGFAPSVPQCGQAARSPV